MKRLLCAGFVLFALGCAAVQAQPWPSKPARLVIGFPPGGGMDGITRAVAQQMSDAAGQPFLVENRPGAGATIAADAVARAAPDGYTLHVAETGFLIAPSMYAKLGFDPVKSFTPVAGLAVLPLAIVAHPAVPAKTIPELIALLKASPGRISYGSPGIGTPQHLAFELFRRQAGVDAVHVPYKGAAPMLPDLIGGQIPLGVISVAPALAQARGGKLRILSVTSRERLPNAPDVPTLAETIPGFEAVSRVFLVGPAGLPERVSARLAELTRAALADKGVLETLGHLGATVRWSPARDLAAEIVTEAARWRVVVHEAGIRPE